MSAFRKFDPYTFLADQEGGGAPSDAAAEAPATLAALATLAGEHPQNENKGSENEPVTGKSGVTPAKAAKFAKAVEEGTGILATLANLAAAHSQNDENERSRPTLAKAAKAANPSVADIRGAAEGLGADGSEPTPAKAAKPANPSAANVRGIADEKRAAAFEYDGGAVRERHSTPSEPMLLAPGNWFDRFGPPGEPSFDQPCPSRRGLVERQGAVLLHFCVTCGAWGAFGYGVVGDRPGRWYCREHQPRPEP
jgi:hypothetical protein